jgi:hypothetical protein
MTKVKVSVPTDLFPSIVNGASGEPYVVKTADNGERFIMASEEDARLMINGGFADQRWKAANQTLSVVLGRPPKPEAGINIAQMQHAHWEMMRPRTIMETSPLCVAQCAVDGDDGCTNLRRGWSQHHGF